MDSLKLRPKTLDLISMEKNSSKTEKDLLLKLNSTTNNLLENSASMITFKKRFSFLHKKTFKEWMILSLKKKINLLLLIRKKRKAILIWIRETKKEN